MSYELEIYKSFPVSFNALNGGRPPLVSGSGSATLLTSAATMPFVPFNRGYEKTQFTLETWYLPLTVSGETVVIGHATEGLLFDGLDFILRIQYVGETLEGRWRLPGQKSYHLAVVYNGGRFTLYVDGEMALSLNSIVDSFSAVGQDIKLNGGAGTGVYDSAALYHRALTIGELREHLRLGLLAPSPISVSSAKGAATWTLSYEDVDILESVTFDNSNWGGGLIDNVSFSDTASADAVDGGSWVVSIPIDSIAGDQTAGVHISWEGEGVSVGYSLTGETWTEAVNDSLVLEEASVTGSSLFVMVDFFDDTSWLRSLTLDVLRDRFMEPFTGLRSLVFTGTNMARYMAGGLNYDVSHGAQIVNGYIEIPPDTESDTTIQSVEAHIKFDELDGWVLASTGSNYVSVSEGVLSATGFAIYKNGVLVSSPTVSVGQWDHYVFVSTSPLSAAIRLGDKLTGGSSLKLTVGHLAAYEEALTAAQVLSIYNANVGAPAAQIVDTGNISMSESGTPYDIYAYSWSIVAGGN